MCKYCEQIGTGDCCDSLIEKKLPLGIAGEIYIDVWLEEGADGKTFLAFSAESRSGRKPSQKNVKIHYCPVCGRNLDRN